MSQEKVCKLIDAIITNNTNEYQADIIDPSDFFDAYEINALLQQILQSKEDNKILKLKLILMIMSDPAVEKKYLYSIAACKGDINKHRVYMASQYQQKDLHWRITSDNLLLKYLYPSVCSILQIHNNQIKDVDFRFDGYVLQMYVTCKDIDYCFGISSYH